ncbi:hypothetical protein O3M35_005577 [Rhynocoris fuscipes]
MLNSKHVEQKQEMSEDKFDFADNDNDFELITNSMIADEKYKSCINVCHGMIYSKTNTIVLNTFNARAFILMQLRFDGYFGFPGGVVDPGEDVTTALNRELSEEVGLTSVKFEEKDKVFMHYNHRKSLVLHFYAKEVSNETFEEIELGALKASDYGNEVLGILRVPLYTMNDGFRGFPAFLKNKFIGNSRNQLLECLKKLNLMSLEEIDKALSGKPLYLQ